MPISTPPLDYKLDREGTSGISTGPELTILDDSDRHVSPKMIGRVCVRGEPLFSGYLLPDGSLDKSPFNSEGWFDTGDLGYMDGDGYLYITGRSKEVINRGGELIAPSEVEDAIMSAAMSPASPISGRVSQALVFAAPHSVLQECVAVALITPPGKARVDLKRLQAALSSSLQQVKWPVLITHMNDLPKKNNKLLRIKLSQRLGLPAVHDDTPYLQRHWEATCPPPDSALTVPIDCSPCELDQSVLCKCLSSISPPGIGYYVRKQNDLGKLELYCAPDYASHPKTLTTDLAKNLEDKLRSILHNYMIPEQIYVLNVPLPTDETGQLDEQLLQKLLARMLEANMDQLAGYTERRVALVFADVLSVHAAEIPRNVDFFSLGGDSLRAGRLSSSLRHEFGIQVPIHVIFNNGTIQSIATYIEGVGPAKAAIGSEDQDIGYTETRSSTNPLLMLLQLAPMMVFYPLRRAFQWTVFIVALSCTQAWPTSSSVFGRLFNVTLSVLFATVVTGAVFPFVGIMAKWTIIGRHRQGLYPMWGLYHTRWWMVQKIVSLSGEGWFGCNDMTKRWYYTLLGAKIGKGVKLAGESLGEWDLLDIRDGAVLTRCICRPFAVERNTSMYLGRIIIGERSTVGISSIVAAGTTIPPNTCIGPNSSSWELHDADEANRTLSPEAAPKPHVLLTIFVTLPLRLVSWFLSITPWIGGLIGMVIRETRVMATPLRTILTWFSEPRRIAFHYLALAMKCFLSPFVIFTFAVVVKWLLDTWFGKLDPSPVMSRGSLGIWRADVLRKLLPERKFHDVTAMFGQHYEATSIALRMLGSKIGNRVYWPGTGPTIGDYHLLDVGSDVVFGSRVNLVTTDGTSSEKITVRDGAMIADRVCLLPGVEVGERTTMGSGALTIRNKTYEAGATYVGSKGRDALCLSTGQQQDEKLRLRSPYMSSSDTLHSLSTADRKTPAQTQLRHFSSDDTMAQSLRSARENQSTYESSCGRGNADRDDYVSDSVGLDGISPFGRAFYLKLAPYHVLGPFAIFCYSSFMTVLTSVYWNVPSVSAVQLVHFMMSRYIAANVSMVYEIGIMYGMCAGFIAVFTLFQAILALGLVIASKWALLGQRQPGNYDWDKSSYCQRWQIFLCIEKIRKSCFHGQGLLGPLTGTHWIVLYFRALGADIGSDCAIFANGNPNLMFTEPDLIKLGDRVAVDDASVVSHVNARGKFDLNRLEIGNRCVLRTGSRLLSGARMKDDSCLLEHTLIMGGDMVESGCTMQGWPAERFAGKRIK